MAYNTPPDQPTDIDLLDLLSRTASFYGRNLIWFGLASIFGIAVGYAVFKIKNKEYSSNMVASSHSLTDGRIIEIVDDLNQLIADQDIPRLAAALGMSVDQAKKINDFEVTSFYEMEKKTKKLNDDKMELKESTTFKLSTSVSDTSLFIPIAKGVVDYLTNNDFAQVQIGAHRKAIEQQLTDIKHRIKLHDSLMTLTQNRLSQSNGNMVISNELSTSQAIVSELEQKKVALSQELSLLQEIRVVKPFTMFKKARWPKLSIAIAVGLAFANIGTLLGLLILGPRFAKRS